jgi:enoyl-CoA hydratase
VGQLGCGQEGGDVFGAVAGEEPFFDEGVYVVELRDFDEDRRHGWGPAGDEFQVAEGSEKGGATTTLGILPALSLLKSESGKEAGETVELSAWRARRGDGADKRDSLNHRFDCIVWEYRTRLLLLLAGLRCRGEKPVNYETLLCEVKDQIGRVTLNRPEVLHALNAKVFNELEHAFMSMTADVAVRVILLTGAGEKAFAAGADINEIARLDVATGEAKARRGQEVFRTIETCGKPVIAGINGFALGGGCELAMACTIRVASETAKLGQPEVKLGLIPGYGGTQRLPRLVGQSRALKLLLTGEMIGAAEALRIGLVDEVVPANQLMERCEELAKTMVGMAPLAIAGCMEAVRWGRELGLVAATDVEAEIFGRLCGTADKAEGTKAFLEKRAPAWTGR